MEQNNEKENQESKNSETVGAVTHTHTHTHTSGSKGYRYSKKYVKKLKKKLQVSVCSIVAVLLLIAIGKLAGFSVPLDNKNMLILTADESKIQNEGEIVVSTTSTENTKNTRTSEVTIADDGAIVCDSIVRGARDCDLEDGNYTFRVTGNIDGTSETKDYAVELINYYDDVIYSLDEGQTSKTVSLGDNTTEYKMLVVKYHKNLTINSGVYVTATAVNSLTYKKGMYLCVMGELKNSGTISMTARGTYNQAGENVYLWKNKDDSLEYVPAVGGAGASGAYYRWTSKGSKDYYHEGSSGGNGKDRATGGGGSGRMSVRGADYSSGNITAGSGSAGTSYSGGSGGGGIDINYGGTLSAGNASPNGGKGGDGYALRGNKSWASRYAGGGAGNYGGNGKNTYSGATSGTNYAGYNGNNGTGGLLVLYSNEFINNGIISSEGSTGGNGRSGGGSSGGGSINIFANSIKKAGNRTATGGSSVSSGGAGGTGSVTVTKTMPDLNYPTKDLKLSINETYNIDKSKITYMNISKEHTDFTPMAEIEYEILDEEIAKIDDSGKITGLKEGKTKVKIKDITNNLSTYVYLEIVNNVKIDVQEGTNFTIALKQNGTVWSYGLNNNGQLGLGDNEDKTEPTQIKNLNNIKEISTGYSHSLALTKEGEVYAWGANTNGQLGDGNEGENCNYPQKVEGISNIIKIDAYKNKSIALSSDGKIYVWGEGYTSLPMRKVFSEKVVDISGDLILTEKGRVYNITNTETAIAGLSDIAKISSGEAHNLALTTSGEVYSSGTNTYGECGVATVGTREVTEIASEIYEISAGNHTSILEGEDGSIYVLGNNANGQIGLGSTKNATGLTKITLSENVEIESISAGEGTHTGIVDTNGFVWHTGLNTKGELGLGDNANKSIYTKTGNTVLNTGLEDKIYLDLDETITINNRLENTFNLKTDLIDDNSENFEMQLSNTEIVGIEGNKLTAKEYGIAKLTVTHKPTGKTREIELIVIKKLDSLVQGIRDTDFTDGEYEIAIKDEIYDIEIYNYYDDMRYSLEEGQTERIVSLGDDSKEHKTLVVKYHGNLTIDKGVTLTATTVDGLTYKKGMYICVLGNTYNNGNISMTARGTYNAEGENVYLWKNIDDSIEYVPAEGGAGANGIYYRWTSKNSKDYTHEGINGNNGIDRATGGGGSGGMSVRGADYSSGNITAGSGSAGTSYSGGSGGGGIDVNYGGTISAGNASPNGGKGGDGFAHRGNKSWASRYAGGGAGNYGGNGKYTYSGATIGSNYSGYNGQNGTGGLLVLYSDKLLNNGNISSNGSNAGQGRAGGGASGGGSINIFARLVKEPGKINVSGGTTNGKIPGGAGGNGTVTINELGSVLNYAKKTIGLKTKEEYQVDRNKLWYLKLNEIQTEDLIIGKLKYETEDKTIAEVDETGKIIAIRIGQTKIKITDEDNGYSTYITVNVTEEGQSKAQIKAGKDFVVALKENGTVWTWGTNENEPVQIKTSKNTYLENIKQIEAGEDSAIALDEKGDIYTWGLNENGQIGTATLTSHFSHLTSQIEKINSYKENYYAIDKEGKAYIWGKEYEEPEKIETEIGIEDIKGEIFLGEDGRIYFIKEPETPIIYLNGISKIDVGEDHYLFQTVEGGVYSIGKGELGQLGKPNYIEGKTPNLVRTEDGYLENVKEISAGNKTGMVITEDGKVYVWGDNTNNKLGIEGKSIYNATEITKLQDKDGRELILKEMEIIEGGTNNSYLGDKDGNVYSVGLNDKGQLGVGDNEARKIFTQVGKIEITAEPKDIKVGKGQTKEIAIIGKNAFNLKRDLLEGQEIKITNTNEKEIKIEKIEETDNEGITNIKEIKANYKITGNKIGRVNIVATNGIYTGNIWINVVNDETAEVPAKVENGKGFTIALKADGSVWSWGTNANGGLGIGNTESKNEPTQISALDLTHISSFIKDISVGENHVIALDKKGNVYTFGLNRQGQLGTGDIITYNKPIKLNLRNIEKVIAKGNTTYAINKEGEVYAWGEKYEKNPSLLSIPENVIDIGKEYYLTAEGKVKKLTDNNEIKLGNGDTENIENEDTEKIVQISEGTDHLLLLGETGRAWAFAIASEFGEPDQIKINENEYLSNITEISAGNQYSIAVDKEGKVYTFGINSNKQLGMNNEVENGGIIESEYAKEKEDIQEVERVEAGYTHTSVYTKEGNVYTWGEGKDGQLGTGKLEEKWEAQKIGKGIVETNISEILIEEGENYKIESKIDNFNLFRESIDEIEYEILDKEIGQIDRQTGEIKGLKEGRTTVVAREKETENKGIIKVRILEKGTKPETMNILVEPQVATAGSRTVMLKVDGTVWCYGIGKYGELGTGEIGNSDEPVKAKFPEGTIITKISVGENHNLALDSKGNVWTWGRNDHYQQGNKNAENILIPTKIESLSNIKDIECGNNTSYAIGKEGQIYSWGQNGEGEGGIGNSTNKIGINQAKGITDAIDIKAGKNHVVILRSTGEIYVTGSNLNGELGLGKDTRKTTEFTKIEGIGTIITIGTGYNHSMAITEDGKVYGWGSNANGELGLGNITKIIQPQQIENLENICYIDGGKGYSLSINNQGEIYATGKNESGELGNGSKTDTSTYQKLETIKDVMQISGGKGHTVILKKDGTVWACGDYTQGTEEIESKTKSETPVQIGNEETEIKETEITLEKGETKELTVKNAYKLNLIKLDENYTDSLKFESLDKAIATVDSKGKITGKEIGATTIKAISTIDQKEYNVQVEVIEKTEEQTSNTNLLKIEIDGDNNVIKGEDRNYHYILQNPKETVEIKATTEDETSYVKIETGEYEQHETTKQEKIISKQEEIKIRVKAEDGSIEEHTLIIERQPDDATLEKVIVNGKEANFIERENKYEIRLNDTELNIEAIAEDKQATVQFINIDQWLENEENTGAGIPQKASNNITITKEGTKTQLKVKVKNGLEEETYTIEILEQSSSNKLDIIEVNGEIIEKGEDGKYYKTIKHAETQINIKAIAEDEHAKTTINETTQNSYIATKTENVVEGKTVYNYTIEIEAENGETTEYELIVEQLDGNTGIEKILVGKTEIDLNEATLREDGKYYYKIDRVEEAIVSVEPESEKTAISINGGEYKKIEQQETEINPEEKVNLPEEINEIPIKVTAEDGTKKAYILIIEKKSDNIEVETIIGEKVKNVQIDEESAVVYIDEEADEIQLTITLKNENGYLKLEGEENYEQKQITRTINTQGTEEQLEIKLNIKAEDGTEKEYIINIIKEVDIELESVVVNEDTLKYDEEKERYEKQVENGNKAQITITASNSKQTIQLLNEERTMLATGTGSLTTTQTPTNLITKYIIKVISNKGEENGTNERELWITQKSTETGIVYVKVDRLGTIVSGDQTTYTSEVSGKEKYPIEIKLKDEKAEVRIEDLEGNTLINNQKGRLTGELKIKDGTTQEYKVIVTAENGTEKEYKLTITRISNNANLEYLKVDGKEKVPDQNGKQTYTVLIEKQAETVEIEAKAEYEKSKIKIGNNEEEIQITKQTIDLRNKTKEEIEIPIEVIAEDGTTKTYNLKLIMRGILVTGEVKTENIEGKHKADITLYKSNNVDENGATEEIIDQIETEEDGTFKMLAEEGTTCNLVISKKGYLEYEITDIEVEEQIDIGKIELIAGDVAVNGEIEIDDLVDMNENVGEDITEENKETKSIFDLNEDGKIDVQDRNILKKNYGKKAEKIKWSKPVEQEEKIEEQETVEEEIEGQEEQGVQEEIIVEWHKQT